MILEFFSVTDTGRARRNNEDSVALDEAGRVAVLADGMGGYNAGEVASGMASERVRNELGQRLKAAGATPTEAEIKTALLDAVDSANREVYDAAMSHPEYAGMGTTLVVAVYRGDRLWLGPRRDQCPPGTVNRRRVHPREGGNINGNPDRQDVRASRSC
jgi:protein phosphatase